MRRTHHHMSHWLERLAASLSKPIDRQALQLPWSKLEATISRRGARHMQASTSKVQRAHSSFVLLSASWLLFWELRLCAAVPRLTGRYGRCFWAEKLLRCRGLRYFGNQVVLIYAQLDAPLLSMSSNDMDSCLERGPLRQVAQRSFGGANCTWLRCAKCQQPHA